MTLAHAVRKGVLVLSSGQGLALVLIFVRNVIIARILGPEQLGIAATFIITVTFVEAIGDIGVDRLIVQAEFGDDRRFQGSAQLVLALRGVMTALVVISCAWPISMLFDVPEARWAYRCVALVPLLRGLAHLDYCRVQRRLQYGPAVFVEVIPQALITIAVWPMVVWLGDYSAVLWLLIAQAASMATISHLLAHRRYSWDWDRKHGREIFSFGWPLLINGALIFGALQGDRIIVGAAYSMEDLGVYWIAFALMEGPRMLLGRVSVSLFLPLLSAVKSAPEVFARRYSITIELLALVGGSIGAILIVAAAPLIVLVYGDEYAAAAGFVGWLAAMLAVRTVRLAPTLAAMSLGDTRNMMFSNLARSASLVAAAIAAALHADLAWIAAAGCGGEMIALFVSLAILGRHSRTLRTASIAPIAVGALWIFCAALASYFRISEASWPIMLLVLLALGLGPSMSMVYLFPRLRQQLWGILRPHDLSGTLRTKGLEGDA